MLTLKKYCGYIQEAKSPYTAQHKTFIHYGNNTRERISAKNSI